MNNAKLNLEGEVEIYNLKWRMYSPENKKK